VHVVYPVHLNPNVRRPVFELLGGAGATATGNRALAFQAPGGGRLSLLPPLDYAPFVFLLSRCHLVLTDSGGIQEEAPALGKPVLVMREVTERPEGLWAGTVRLVGTAKEKIVREVIELLDQPAHYQAMARAENPYGDGRAAMRIVQILQHLPASAPRTAVPPGPPRP
jgi:UDP-N-acetylglucosamine 2-epimerase